ncbi:MAG: ABC transporter permease [Thermoprotei archaeon]|nr:MAG: ABC transporter permease [Thermoprotei archaeon]
MGELKYYLIRRLLTFIPTIIGVTLLTFLIARVIPANPAVLWAGGIKAKPEVVQLLIKKYHLDKPPHIQYFYYLKDIFTGHWGISPVTHRPVIADIATYFPATAELALFSLFVTIFIGIPLGVISALKKDTWIDHVVRIIAISGASMPVFWLGIILQWIFYYSLGLLPATGRGIPPRITYTGLYLLDSLLCGDFEAFRSNLQHIILPGFTLAYPCIGLVARITRSSVLDVLSADFIDYARIRGLKPSFVFRHVFRNASIPIITILGLLFGSLLCGAVITETVFSWPGLGTYTVAAISNIDYPAIMGVTLIIGLVYVTVNLIVDILYAIIDPRIRL